MSQVALAKLSPGYTFVISNLITLNEDTGDQRRQDVCSAFGTSHHRRLITTNAVRPTAARSPLTNIIITKTWRPPTGAKNSGLQSPTALHHKNAVALSLGVTFTRRCPQQRLVKLFQARRSNDEVERTRLGVKYEKTSGCGCEG